MVYQLERAAPTPTQEAIMVTLQWLAFFKGFGTRHRSDKHVWTVSQDVTKKQARDKIAIRYGTCSSGSRPVVACPNLDLWTGVWTKLAASQFGCGCVPKGYLSNTKEVGANINGVNGGLGSLASTGRPDMAATHSIIPSGYDRRSPQLISEVNAAVKQCHAVPITITIRSLPF